MASAFPVFVVNTLLSKEEYTIQFILLPVPLPRPLPVEA